jgi:thiamine kinase-like enzyme
LDFKIGMLLQKDVVLYLLRRNLLTSDTITDGDLEVIDVSRRNHNFAVMCNKKGQSYLLKQGVGPERVQTIAHEARAYQYLRSQYSTEQFNHLPHFYEYDEEEHILILEMLPKSENLREYHARRNRFSPSIAAEMGKGLGTFHHLTRATPQKDSAIAYFASRPPWILSIHRPDTQIIQGFSSASIQLIKIVQQFEYFCQLLDIVFRGWQTDSLIHSDIRWDNWIICLQRTAKYTNRLKLVDWETMCLGDPCWDVGSVFSDYLSAWLLSIPITGEIPLEKFPELARHPLTKLQPAIRTFWQSYVQNLELNDHDLGEWLLRATKYTAVKLMQTGFEQMQFATQLTGNIICLLQVCLNILMRPQEACVHLLGLPSHIPPHRQ